LRFTVLLFAALAFAMTASPYSVMIFLRIVIPFYFIGGA
jgi:hypothetical protein